MRKTQIKLSLLTVFVLLTTLTGNANAAPPTQKAKWTVMVYISGDNNLEDYVVKDIELELAPTGSSANVQVVALADRGPGYDTSYGDWQTTKLFHVIPSEHEGRPCTCRCRLGCSTRMNYMGDQANADRFRHMDESQLSRRSLRLVLLGSWLELASWLVMQDDTDNDTLDMEEIKAALPSIGFIDMVGFDGCQHGFH